MLRSIKKSMTYQLANAIDEHRREDERFSSMFFCFLTSSVEHKKSLSELSFDKEPDKHISRRLCRLSLLLSDNDFLTWIFIAQISGFFWYEQHQCIQHSNPPNKHQGSNRDFPYNRQIAGNP